MACLAVIVILLILSVTGFRFIERGRIFAMQEVKVIQIGTGGLFFTGDAAGEIFVWKLHAKPSSEPSMTGPV